MARNNKLKAFWTKYKLTARLKPLIVVCLVVLFVTPLRNFLLPWWPHILKQLSTLKVIQIHLVDLFYYVDRSPYKGSCEFVHSHLASVKMPKLKDMPVYDMNDWIQQVVKIKPNLDDGSLLILDNYKPSLSIKEQRELLFTMLSVTQALAAFNITYFISEGTLIGYWRHHGLIPWDDDADILFDSDKWPLAKQVLSCLPDLGLYMGSDYMWKVFHKEADNWLGEQQIRFPYVDLFMYKHDNYHLWPVCIWMKTEIIVPLDWALPVAAGVFEGYPVSIPRKTVEVLDLKFGRVDSDCYSRTFSRRERQMLPVEERTHMPCSVLKPIYPFVARNRVDKVRGTVIEERILGSTVLSTFNTTYYGTLE
ncbi:unnamed protein product [Candidula unifasciata]|uniref:LicD/FKTN/FKRP nucleotidyltransferase domain-containing protein n=1 Tax=Candidula unifasciata TaxID=100452 RepID=A0A8S3YN68_9EUPU|nr:unnamed protein product [Candidula unifasciata]